MTPAAAQTMTVSHPTAPRLHALDNLRALMMWLGIVLHVAANHLTGPMLLPWRDQATSRLADLLAAAIHTFRMPVFLVLAGYFVALLVERHGPGSMLRHRLRRIALPFVLFWPVLYGATGVLAMLYVHRVERGHFGISTELLPTVPHVPLVNTMHLWFLYQLVGLTLLTFAVLWWAPRLPRAVHVGVSQAFRLLGERAWGAVVLALPLGVIGAQYPFGVLTVTGSFVPPLNEWLHHGLFYAFGYFLHAHRDRLLTHYADRSIRYALAGALAFVVSVGLVEQVQRSPDDAGPMFRVLAAWTYNTASWLWSFALIGLALRCLGRHSRAMQYMADSSYWVYLVHMLGTIGFGAVLYGLPLAAELKMLLNIAATTAVSLITYQVFVRNTAIGQLLNGRRIAGGPTGRVQLSA